MESTHPASSFRQERTTNGGGGRRWFHGATGPARLALAVVQYELGTSPVEAFESSNIDVRTKKRPNLPSWVEDALEE